MSTHSIADAKNRLSRSGPISASVRNLSADDLDWLVDRRPDCRVRQNAGSLVSSLRDEAER
jgi:hypothetical protein